MANNNAEKKDGGATGGARSKKTKANETIPLIAALAKTRSNNVVLLLATRSKKQVNNWHTMNLFIPHEGDPETIVPDPENGVNASFIVAGVGNSGHLETLVGVFKQIVCLEAQNYGFYNSLDMVSVGRLSGILSSDFRSTDTSSPYKVEMVFVSMMNGQMGIFRLKNDGEFHGIRPPYCILGGQQKVPERDVTVRHEALRKFSELYGDYIEGKGLPRLGAIYKLTKEILALHPSFKEGKLVKRAFFL